MITHWEIQNKRLKLQNLPGKYKRILNANMECSYSIFLEVRPNIAE